ESLLYCQLCPSYTALELDGTTNARSGPPSQTVVAPLRFRNFSLSTCPRGKYRSVTDQKQRLPAQFDGRISIARFGSQAPSSGASPPTYSASPKTVSAATRNVVAARAVASTGRYIAAAPAGRSTTSWPPVTVTTLGALLLTRSLSTVPSVSAARSASLMPPLPFSGILSTPEARVPLFTTVMTRSCPAPRKNAKTLGFGAPFWRHISA